jgi:ribosome-associated protein
LTELDSYQTACVMAGILDEKKAKDIVILDISRVSIMADYFVICSTDTATQLRALSDIAILELKQKYNRPPKSEQRDKSGKWFLIDYGDVVVHLLHKEAREYYAIEKFWSHAFVIDREKWIEEFEKAS